MNYQDFIKSKEIRAQQYGFEPRPVNPMLFQFQSDIAKWAIRIGRAAIFADCGLGKTLMQLEWAQQVTEHTGMPVLILAPLAVSHQTKREGERFGYSVVIAHDQSECGPGVNVTNYQKLHKFDPSRFSGIVLDESSILKNYSGKIRRQITDSFRDTPYRLACTATPAPNDHMELGTHSEFLGIMRRVEMLSMFFVHDGGDTAKWRLKGHAEESFYKWLASWAVMLRSPEDLGYDACGFDIPELRIHRAVVETDHSFGDMLFKVEAKTMDERRAARRDSIEDRVKRVAEICNSTDEQYVVWCNLNTESAAAASSIRGAVEVTGSDTDEHKEAAMLSFGAGNVRVLVTKPSIAGFGMNWQNCKNVLFLGLSDSYEQFYQAVRRCWRFGQKSPVDVHVVTADTEGEVVRNILRKENDASALYSGLVKHISIYSSKELGMEAQTVRQETGDVATGDGWKFYHGDCIDVMRSMDEGCVDYSVFSPPFADLYTYSNNPEDMGNSRTYEEFFEHFAFFAPELFRIIKPGRLVSVHCTRIPSMKERDGVIGLKNFPGDIVAAMQKAGFIYHSSVTIWKDPLVEATRTKALGLMHKQVVKDAAMCRQGLPDILETFRKPGDNPNPVTHEPGFTEFIGENPPKAPGIKQSHLIWQRYASPVWMDINQTRTLQRESAREDKDEKHICPLQLDVIERCIALWTNPGDVVFTPFGGIGSEGYSAIRMGRRAILAELKRSYFDQGVRNMRIAESERPQQSLFSDLGELCS